MNYNISDIIGWTACASWAMILLTTIGASSWALAAWLVPQGSAARRWSAAVVVANGFQIGSFQILAGFGAFRLLPAVLLSCLFALTAAGLHRWLPRGDHSLTGLLLRDLRHALARLDQALATPARPLVLAVLATILILVARGFLNIPVTTDSLTYHLYYAGMFVQTGGWFDIDTPGAWGVTYRFYPTGGEMLTAWLMLPFHGDLVAGLVSLPSWGLLLAALYELGRQLGLAPRRAALAAGLAGFMPAVFGFAASVYVDIPLIACLVAASLFFLDAWRTDAAAPAFLCGIALGCGLAIKIFALAGVGAVAVVFLLRWIRPGPRPLWPLAALLTGMAALGFRHYGLLYARFGSPTWPLPLGLPGLPIFAGSAAWAEKLRHLAETTDATISGGSLWREIAWYITWYFGFKPVSIGPTGFVALVLAPAGLVTVWKRVSRGFAIYLSLVLAASAAALFGSGMWKFHVIFASVNARLNTLPFALLILLAFLSLERWEAAPRRLVTGLLVLLSVIAATGSLVSTWTTGFPTLDGVLLLLPPLAALLPIRKISINISARLLAVAACGLFLLLILLQPAKAAMRPRQLLAAHEGYELGREASRAWVVCDDPARPRRIAFSAGWGPIGYDWSWAPLLGRNLQNHVTYLPITASGAVIEYDDPARLAREASFDAWLGRLRERRIDTVVLFPPFPPEHGWVNAHPNLFLAEDTASPPLVFRLSPAR
ncbi:MAG TPA: glycosyltransferase family 39 protein [Candidatus Ozemobacteraceae bacterium]|nr:glycosyltransferase family 39 protein [Candidatus Ozemobacteraceae bacterium]